MTDITAMASWVLEQVANGQVATICSNIIKTYQVFEDFLQRHKNGDFAQDEFTPRLEEILRENDALRQDLTTLMPIQFINNGSGQIIFNFNFNNSSDYQQLRKELQDSQDDVRNFPNHQKSRQSLENKEREMKNFQQYVEQMHKHFTQMYEQFCNEPCHSKRLNDAKQAFNDGDLAKVRFLLDEKELIADQEYWLAQKDNAQHNLVINAQYWKLKALATATDFSLKNERLPSVCRYFELVLKSDDSADNHFEYATFLEQNKQFQSAKSHYQQALQKYQQLSEQSNQYLFNFATTLRKLGYVLRNLNDYISAEKKYREALEIYERCRNLHVNQSNQCISDGIARTLNNLARLLNKKGKSDDAKELYEQVLLIYKNLAREEPEKYLPDIAKTCNCLGVTYRKLHNYESSLDMHRQALKIREGLAEQDDKYTPDFSLSLHNLARAFSDIQDYEKSYEMYEKALQIRKRLVYSKGEIYLPNLARTLLSFANFLKSQGSFVRAQSLFEEALDIYDKLAEEQSQVYLPDLAETLGNFGDLLVDLEKYNDAQKMYERALPIYQNFAAIAPEVYQSRLERIQNKMAQLKSTSE